jgi:hypothetical protein
MRQQFQIRRAHRIRRRVLHVNPAKYQHRPGHFRLGHQTEYARWRTHNNRHDRIEGQVVQHLERQVRRVPHPIK